MEDPQSAASIPTFEFLESNEPREAGFFPSMPPLGSFEGVTTEPGRRRKSIKRVQSGPLDKAHLHGHGPTELVKLALMNAMRKSGSHDNLHSGRSSNSPSPSPSPHIKTPRDGMEILLRHDTESDDLLLDDPQIDVNTRHESDAVGECGQKHNTMEGLYPERMPSRNSSRGSSFDFDSGVSSLTSLSVCSTRSLIQLARSTTMRGISTRMLEQHNSNDLTEMCDQCSEKEPTEASPSQQKWNLSVLPYFLRDNLLRPRRHTDPTSPLPVSRPQLQRSFTTMLFGAKASQVHPDLEEREILCSTRGNQHHDEVGSAVDEACSSPFTTANRSHRHSFA